MNRIFLPSIHSGKPLPGGMRSEAHRFAQSWLSLQGDRRDEFRSDVRLVAVAQKHATWLANFYESGSFHVGKDGSAANGRVRDGGYRLPGNYPSDQNYVESVTTFYESPEEAAVFLSNHGPHYDHMHSQGPYKDHTVYGFAYDFPFYVCLICPEED